MRPSNHRHHNGSHAESVGSVKHCAKAHHALALCHAEPILQDGNSHGRRHYFQLGRLLVLGMLASAGTPGGATAQGILNQFSSENLRPSALQLDLGPLAGDNILGTLTGGARLDYGFVAPKIRVLLGLSYFHADLSSDALRHFAD